MGLEIIAYRGLTPAPDAPVDSDGYPEDWEAHLRIRAESLQEAEKYWPGRTAGLAPGIYSHAGSYGFRAGSYSGYNEWRDRLAYLAGYYSAESVWKDKPTGPFVELIDFSDCEGYIGPTVAAKLSQDFAAFADKIRDLPDWFRELYGHWRHAFDLAADGGCVVFH